MPDSTGDASALCFSKYFRIYSCICKLADDSFLLANLLFPLTPLFYPIMDWKSLIQAVCAVWVWSQVIYNLNKN